MYWGGLKFPFLVFTSNEGSKYNKPEGPRVLLEEADLLWLEPFVLGCFTGSNGSLHHSSGIENIVLCLHLAERDRTLLHEEWENKRT